MRNRPTKEEIKAELERRGESVETNGFEGIINDLNKSFETSPQALKQMLQGIPGGVKRVGHYASTKNPLSTLGNIFAGGVEGSAALLSSPQVLMRYLSEKFPDMQERLQRGRFEGRGINDPTMFEQLTNFEKDRGLSPVSEEEASVRNAGNLLLGGAAISRLPNMLLRSGAIGAEQGGMGGDPVHGALLGTLGEMLGRAPWKKAPQAITNIAEAAPQAIRQIPKLTANIGEIIGSPMSAGLKIAPISPRQPPQLKANMGQAIGGPLSVALKNVPDYVSKATNKASIEALQSAAEVAAKYHVPILPKKLLTKAAKIKYSTDPELMAKEALFEDIEHEDIADMADRNAAFKLLGLNYGTIGELLDSPYESGKQGSIGRTPKGKKLLLKQGEGRLKSEEASINKTLDDIYNKNMLSPEKNEAYRETMTARVPDEFVQKWSNDPVVKKAMDELKNESAYQKSLGANPDKNSFRYWDHVKKVIGDMESGTEKVKGTKKFKKSIYTGTRNEMVREMDAIKPEYANARRISELEHIRGDIETYFNKRDKTGNNFYKFLNDTQKFDNLMERLENVPVAQQKLKAWKLIGKGLIPETTSNRAAKALEHTSMSRARNEVDAIQRALEKKYGQEHDVAKVRLITNPDLMSLISEHLENKKGINQ